MNECISLPRSALTEALWRNGSLAQLYLFLLSEADARGVVILSLRDVAKHTGLSLQAVRTALRKLESTQRITQAATQRATQITLCGIGKNETPPTQQSTQSATQVATQSKTLPNDELKQFMDYFNNGFAGTLIPKITKLTERRKTALRNIFKEYGPEAVREALHKVYASDFLMGRATEWHATFDWIFKKTNFQKILEDNYVNRTDSRQCAFAGNGQQRTPTTYDLARAILGGSAD